MSTLSVKFYHSSIEIADDGNRVVLTRKDWARSNSSEELRKKREEDLNYLHNFMDPYGEIQLVTVEVIHEEISFTVPVAFTADTWIAFIDRLEEA